LCLKEHGEDLQAGGTRKKGQPGAKAMLRRGVVNPKYVGELVKGGEKKKTRS